METIPYKPFEKRTPDRQYQDALRQIMEHGRDTKPIQGEGARSIVGMQMHFDMRNGFPLITERDISKLFKGGLSEGIAFLNGARTQEQLEAFGCKWWNRWVTPEKCAQFGLPPGDLGDGSYGAAWTNFPTSEGKPFDQIEHVMKQIKERPFLRTHFISPWIPQYTIQHSDLKRKVVVAPCHGWVHIFAYPDTKELAIHHFQRSCDMPVGVPFNMLNYAAMGLMIGHLIGYTFVEYVHSFSDAHIYASQFEAVKELISLEPKRLPTVKLDLSAVAGITNIKDFRPEHFVLTDYDPHPAMKVPTPV